LSNLKLCFLYATYACGKSYSTFSKTTFQSWYVYSYLSCNYDAYILHMLMTIIRAFLLSSSNGKSGNGLLRDRPDRITLIYLLISVTTPAPTVRPPSRIANRSSLSIAIGVISVTSIATLSPGITISVPSGNLTEPVTSVVRK